MKAAYLWLLLIYALMLVLVFRAGHEPYDPTLLDYHVLELEAGAIPGDILPAGNPEASAELRAYLETQGVELPPGGTIALGFGAFHFLNMESQQANIEAWLDRLVGRRNWRGPLPHYRLVFTLGTRELRGWARTATRCSAMWPRAGTVSRSSTTAGSLWAIPTADLT